METIHLQQQLKLVSTVLDRMQSDHCTLGDAVHNWIELTQAAPLLPYKGIIEKRYHQCITPAHLVAYQAHPKYKGAQLTQQQEDEASDWLNQMNPDYVPCLLALAIDDTDVYPKSMLAPNVTEALTPTKWWRVIKTKSFKSKHITEDFCDFMAKISSLPASSASIERLFSTFGFVHNKLRNRLGMQKAEKLVKCHKC